MKKRIRILATSDLHGTIFPLSYADGSRKVQGIGCAASLINAMKDENTILVDNGDTLEGSPLSFYHYSQHPEDPSPMTLCMNELGYDYVNIGNHEFDYGEEALQKHLDTLKMPCLTSNVLFHNKPIGPTYAVREIAGKKLAIFALCTQSVSKWENKHSLKHYRFQDAFETAQKTIDLIHRLENPDYVICLYHGGFERDPETGRVVLDAGKDNEGTRMLENLRGLDVLITGHKHRNLCGIRNNIAYTQTRANGEAVACIDIYTDTGVIEPRILVTEGSADETVTNPAAKEEAECQKWLDQPLGTSEVDMKIDDPFKARLSKSQLITFINKVEMEATGAQLAASSLFHHATGFGREITMRQLVNSYSFSNTLVVKMVSGKVLREYLEKCAEYWSIGGGHIIVSPLYEVPTPKHYNYDMVDGIDYTITVSEDPGHRITELKYEGADVTDDMEFTLALNSYRAGGGGDFTMLTQCPTIKEVNTSMPDLIASWILEHKVVDFEPVHNIHVVK